MLLPVIALLNAMNPTAIPSPALESLCTQVIQEAAVAFQALPLHPENVSLTVIDVEEGPTPRYRIGHFQGEKPTYPASVVKLCYLAYGAHLRDEGKLKMTPEIERAFQEMIKVSDNDATAFLVDVLTDTTSGPELSPKELAAWKHKREVVNRWLESRGFHGLNASQKTWSFGPYGRDRQSYGEQLGNRNSLTSNAMALLMAQILTDQIASPKSCEWMRGILKRTKEEEEGKPKIVTIAPKGSQVWSKSGWTSETRHDVAAVRLPNGKLRVLAIFTSGYADEVKLIPFLAERLLER